MVGKKDMGLAGWKQLILWSIEHACLDDAEREAVMERWEKLWEEFLKWVVKTYGDSVREETSRS
jgi:adenosine deaminase CECR1